MEYWLSGTDRLTGSQLKRTEEFLERMGLRYEGGADHTVQLVSDDGDILGTGSLCGNILKYIAVAPELQGEGASLSLVSALVAEALARGRKRLFVFTKAMNEQLFRGMGFYTLAATRDVCFMENSRGGLARWLDSIPKLNGTVGAAVMNCNPFTNGHRYLVETASREVDSLYVFVVSEDRSRFPFSDRIAMVREGTADLENVTVLPSGDYMISQATFPTYFLKDASKAGSVYAELDCTLFAERIAPALNIKRRFVGTEPYCALTESYNSVMKTLLPRHGVEVTEIPRAGGISASRVRDALDRGAFDEVGRLVPETTLKYLLER